MDNFCALLHFYTFSQLTTFVWIAALGNFCIHYYNWQLYIQYCNWQYMYAQPKPTYIVYIVYIVYKSTVDNSCVHYDSWQLCFTLFLHIITHYKYYLDNCICIWCTFAHLNLLEFNHNSYWGQILRTTLRHRYGLLTSFAQKRRPTIQKMKSLAQKCGKNMKLKYFRKLRDLRYCVNLATDRRQSGSHFALDGPILPKLISMAS